MLVPDGVASVTIHFPVGHASGYRPEISPPTTITVEPIGNELVVRIPRSYIPETPRGLKMTWRAPDGRVVRTFNRL